MKKHTSLDVQLVTALADQLYGTITLNRTKETTFHDCFEYKGP
jgi:hypothetical protein